MQYHILCIQGTHVCSAVCDDCAFLSFDYVRLLCVFLLIVGLYANYVWRSPLWKSGLVWDLPL